MSEMNTHIDMIHDILKNNTYSMLKIIKCNQNDEDIVIHFILDTHPIKITTDFKKYCLLEAINNSMLYNFNNFNLNMIIKEKEPSIILNELLKCNFSINKSEDAKHIYSDPFHISQKLEEFTKFPVNYIKLNSLYMDNIKNNIKTKNNFVNMIPKGLLLLPEQVIQLLINEIKKINRNSDYQHIIVPDMDNPYSFFIRLKFNPNTKIGTIFEQIQKLYGYDYMELKIIINPNTYPFIPPTLQYIKPKIKLPLLLSIMNLDILNIKNWIPSITLDFLICNLSNALENIASDYIVIDDNMSYSELEYALINLSNITKEVTLEIKIKIPLPIISNNTTENKYWKAGTGYGYENLNNWDINKYIKEQEIQKNDITNCLEIINNNINQGNINNILESPLIKYIVTVLKGFSMIELENNRLLFAQIINITTNFIGIIKQNEINIIANSLRNIYNELTIIFNTSKDYLNDELLLQIFCAADWYQHNYSEIIVENKEIQIYDIKQEYCQIMKKLQFAMVPIADNHRFISNKSVKPEQKALMRMLSEISSFKNGLPLNWESTIWTRVPKDNFNLFTFLISGPKDTPYENGLFEFHVSLPANYPSTVPNVLLHTTGNNTVRFNPNLYANGKVCLSLLGTWNGQEGESWNPKTSTFLQVMVSIQSLIFVEQPYFNEPGYEKKMNSDVVMKTSNEYNEEKQYQTINLAMINMINNPPVGYEDVIANHFRMKKQEIIDKTLIWENKCKIHNNIMHTNREQLIILLKEKF